MSVCNARKIMFPGKDESAAVIGVSDKGGTYPGQEQKIDNLKAGDAPAQRKDRVWREVCPEQRSGRPKIHEPRETKHFPGGLGCFRKGGLQPPFYPSRLTFSDCGWASSFLARVHRSRCFSFPATGSTRRSDILGSRCCDAGNSAESNRSAPVRCYPFIFRNPSEK